MIYVYIEKKMYGGNIWKSIKSTDNEEVESGMAVKVDFHFVKLKSVQRVYAESIT